jgi:ATP-dependent RNA helicase DeaD
MQPRLLAEGLHGDNAPICNETRVMKNSNAHENRNSHRHRCGCPREIDVSNVDYCYIISTLPQNPEYYLHRIGRTGRAGKTGIAVTLASGRLQMGGGSGK